MRRFRKMISKKGKEKEKPNEEVEKSELSAHQQPSVPQPSGSVLREYAPEIRTMSTDNVGAVDVQGNPSGELSIVTRIEEQHSNYLTTHRQPGPSSLAQYIPPSQQSPNNLLSTGFLANAQDVMIAGGSFQNIHGDRNSVHVHVDVRGILESREDYISSQQRQAILQASTSPSAAGSGNVSRRQEEIIFQAQPDQHHIPSVSITEYSPDNSNVIYQRHLTLRKRGFPLWIPGPNMELPIPYRRKGVDIGDVGIITPSGGFSFLFNIRLPANDPLDINPPVLPEGFAPISPPVGPRELRRFRHFGPGSYLASTHIEKIQDDLPPPGLSFKTSAAEGAILTLPEGAIELDIQNVSRFEAYAIANIESWYRYANGKSCGLGAKNGEIRLVIGCDKATSWGLAAIANMTQHKTHHLKYRPSENVDGRRTSVASIPLYQWEYSGMAETRVGPELWEIEELNPTDDLHLEIDGKYWNQSLFLRTLNVTLEDEVFNTINEELKLALIEEHQQFRNTGGSNNAARISFNANSGSGSTFQQSSTISGNQRSSGSALSGPGSESIKQVGSVTAIGKERATVSISPSAPKSHPADFLNKLLLQKANAPNIRAVVTQDKHWYSVITDDDKIMPNADELAKRVLAAHYIREVDGIIFLEPKDHPSQEPQYTAQYAPSSQINIPSPYYSPLVNAHLAAIEVVDDLEEASSSKEPVHFVIVYVDDKEIAKSKKNASQPAHRWEWLEDHQFPFHPSSTIKVVIYLERMNHIANYVVGQHTAKVIELLDNDAIIGLDDETVDAEITSKFKFKIDLSLVPQPENTFKRFMKTVDDNVSRLENADLASAGTSALGALGRALQLTKDIIDIVVGTHPILQASLTVMSAVYTVVQQVELLDDTVRALAENLRETLSIAKEHPDLLLLEGTTNVIEDIGRTSLKVVSLIHEYILSFTGRAVTFQSSDDMKLRIAQCQEFCDDLKQKFDRGVTMDMDRQLKIIKDDQLADKIYQWLSAPDSSKNYYEAREKHQKGTCSWFLEGERFREFQEKADFLWLKGKAGSGKTILCSSIIDKIILLHKENPSSTYAYFFFDGRDSQKDLHFHDNLIRSLIAQLSLHCGGIPTALVELYGHGYQQPSTESLEDILYNIIDGVNSAYIVIDSLDQCVERNRTLKWIKGIVSRKIRTMHMVVLSRPEGDIEDILQPLDPRCIDLTKESSNDIMIYLEQQLSVIKKWDEATKNIVKSTLAERSEGMFRWVALQLVELKKCSNRRSVMEQLNSLPGGLYDTYERILLKINEADRDDTKTLLRWLCFSTRPMTLSQIAEAVVIEFDEKKGPHYKPSRRYWDERDVLEKCSEFIINFEGMVKLAHLSIKDYLLSDHLRKSTSSIFHLTSAELSHSLISQTCLAYLLQFDADNLVDSDVAISYPLAPYAAEHWISHAKAGGFDKSESSWTLSLAKSLFTPMGAAFTNWVRIWDLDDPSTTMQNREQRSIAPPLYYASLAGLQQICLHLLKEVDVNERGGVYGTVLQAASSQGHEAIAKLLLEKGADPTMQGGKYGNALQAAAYSGQQAIVEVLLEKGVDAKTQGGWYGNALQAASYSGRQTIVKMLLKNGADANAQGGKYGNALQAASYSGQQAIVKVLLEKGADVNTQGGEYSNALQAASCQGHEAIVQLLLEKGADVNAEGGDYRNALYEASYQGHGAVVKLLLKYGADVNKEGGDYGNALQAASYQGHEAVAKLLLEYEANPNAQGGDYGNALYAASYQGHETVVELLLENGADPNAQGGEYGNALLAAVIMKQEVITRLLLDHGADVNAQGEYFTPLKVASVVGNEGFVEPLLEDDDASSEASFY